MRLSDGDILEFSETDKKSLYYIISFYDII
jgi:hypothetical protein